MIVLLRSGARATLLAGLIAAPAAAGSSVLLPEPAPRVVFSQQVQPVLKRSCLACHNATKAKAKLNLETVDRILEGSADGPVVVPGRAEESLLYILSAHLEDPVMPPENNKSNAPDLEPDELALLKRWIDEGAEDDGAAAAAMIVEFGVMPESVDAIYSVALAPGNMFAAAGRGNRIEIYHLPTGRSIGELRDPALADPGGAAHLDIVGSLAFANDGLLASGGFRNVKLWRRTATSLEATLPPLAAEPSASAVSTDGRWALVGDTSGGASLYALTQSGVEPLRFQDHQAAVTGVGLAAGDRLVTVSLDKTVKIRPAGDPGAVRQLAELPSPIHSLAMVAGGTRVACGCADGVVRVVAVDDGSTVAELAGHEGIVTALDTLDAPGNTLVSGGADAALQVWDVGSPAAPLRKAISGSPVAAAAASADGKHVATLGADGALRLWHGGDLSHAADLDTGAATRRRLAEAEAALGVASGLRDTRKRALEAAESSWAEEREKARAAAAAEAAAVAELASKRTALEAAEASKRRADEALAIRTSTGAGDTKREEDAAKAAGDAAEKALEEADLARRNRDEARGNAQLAVRLSSRAAEATAAADAALALAEAEVATTTAALETATAAAGEPASRLLRVAFTADGHLVVAAAEDGNVFAWGAESGAAAGEFATGSAPASLAPAGGSRILVSGTDKSLALYDPVPRWQLERTIGAPDDPDTFADRINAVAFSPDGRRLATGGGVPSRSGELKVWSVRDGTELCADTESHSDAISAVAFSPDGQRIATAATDRFVKVFSSEDGSFARAFEGHTNHVLDVAWSADGLTLASSGADNVVKLWDYGTGTQKQTLTGHSKPVTSVAFVGTGETVLSSSGDQTVRLANEPLPDAGTFVHAAASSRDGAIIAAGGEDSILRIWRASDRQMVFKLP